MGNLSSRVDPRNGFTGRVMVLLDNVLIGETVRLTLNHGRYSTRQAKNVAEAREIVADWEPHVAVVDMDIGGTEILVECWEPGHQVMWVGHVGNPQGVVRARANRASRD